MVITTPNTWYFRSRLQFLLRGFRLPAHGGRQRGQDYITYFPWSYPQLHLLLSHYGYVDITLHEVDEVKPKRMLEHLLALPSRLYYRQRIKRAESEEARQFWREAARDQSAWPLAGGVGARSVEDMAA